MVIKLKIIYDFFRLWINYGDFKEAWQDANLFNDEEVQGWLKELEETVKDEDLQ